MTDGVARVDLTGIDQVVVRAGLNRSVALKDSVIRKVRIIAVEYRSCSDVDYALIIERRGDFQHALLYINRAGIFECAADYRLVRAVGRANRLDHRTLINEGAIAEVRIRLDVEAGACAVGKAPAFPVADVARSVPGAGTIVDNPARPTAPGVSECLAARTGNVQP